MIETLQIKGYRSLRDFRLGLGRVTVVTGENGVGKSNLYRALALLQRMAQGRFAEAIAEEGGMPSAMWAGKRRSDEAAGISWELQHSDFAFSSHCTLYPAEKSSVFQTDPDLRTETLRYGGPKGRVVAQRKGPAIDLRNGGGVMEREPLPYHVPESMISEVRDGIRFPTLAAVRETFLSWRFYHQFRTDADSPMRRAQVGFHSPILAQDGVNLAATLATIQESGREDILKAAVDAAFPEMEWRTGGGSAFQLSIRKPGLRRELDAAELSDGTLRFFCLCAALLSPKPPPLLVLNEPENSLHLSLIPPLAQMIAEIPETTQILVVTHSQLLADEIRERCEEPKVVKLISVEGETRREGQGNARRVWTLDD